MSAAPALRSIDTGILSARRNVAMSAALAELRRSGAIPDTLRFHRYRPCVLIGRHQRIDEAVDRAACAREGIEIARRITGGGAIVVVPSMLAFEFVLRHDDASSRDEIARILCEAVASGLSRLEPRARFRAPNAIVVDGRKLCGTAGQVDGTTLLYQGMILVTADLPLMARILASEARAEGVDPPLADRQTSHLREIGRAPAHHELVEALADSVSAALSRPVLHGPVTPRELSLAETLHGRELGTDGFVETGEAPAAPVAEAALAAAR